MHHRYDIIRKEQCHQISSRDLLDIQPRLKQVVTIGYANDGQAIFRVLDEGIGIPEEDLRHIAEPFRRGSNAETIPGTGLGLSIAQRAVELHGGTISIESEEGNGTLVAVTIPLRAHKNTAAAPA